MGDVYLLCLGLKPWRCLLNLGIYGDDPGLEPEAPHAKPQNPIPEPHKLQCQGCFGNFLPYGIYVLQSKLIRGVI